MKEILVIIKTLITIVILFFTAIGTSIFFDYMRAGDFLGIVFSLIFTSLTIAIIYFVWKFNPFNQKKTEIVAKDKDISTESEKDDVIKQIDSEDKIHTEEQHHEINFPTVRKNETFNSPSKPVIQYTIENIPNEYISFDIETTGLRTTDEIIQIGAVHFLNGKEISSFTTYVNPSIPISDKITNLTGITNQDVEDAPDIDMAASLFMNFIGDLPVAGYNSNTFDIPFLRRTSGIDLSKRNHFDVFKFVTNSPLELSDNKLTTVKYFYGIENQAHDALNDARATALIVEKFRKKDFTANKKLYDKNIDFDGAGFCITGKMNSGKKVIEQLIEERNGIVKSGMSKKVKFLIAGPQVSDRIKEDGLSGKERKFNELIEKGHDAQKLTEEEFLDSLSN
ncbi:exonuclease domain-containing protein [Aerococcus sp. UMB8608]|uniref:DNA polymerase III polC-type n=1 Tax=Aerococcus sanguinicola TaxID=119206 RepID=A0A0X8F9J7_9LACT|nr:MULTISPECIES: exonuclease domain-containing protein [Aerococcus]AMB93286.1 hypothetical protein AWM72_00120 [Aerococcus sanguinicola]MDK6679385.1 exonuclease domain-containing protein [Aerococcus sp. UMB8608]MDK6685773.1 exonuclease domain-containing protein [Aerococcus sp. UMB8623]OFT95918.1 hypothetical protein HMPREF3090_03600 [Aerococcus sp. HMSC23C02]